MPRWSVLASDFDGTLAVEGWVPVETLAAVTRFRKTGGRLVLITGRRLEELFGVFPETDSMSDLVIAENGGVLYDPATGASRALGPVLPDDTREVLRASGVGAVEHGTTLVSASRDDEIAVRRAAHHLDRGWPCQVVPNRDRVMLLPRGVDKGTGLGHALAALGATSDEVIAIGDGENDVPLLRAAGLGIAVADAVQVLRTAADVTTRAPSTQGVVEAIDTLLAPAAIREAT